MLRIINYFGFASSIHVTTVKLLLTPLSPNSDQHQFSPNDIHTMSRDQVMRTIKMITNRVVTKISSCRVNTRSRQGIKRLGISFGSIFLLFSNKSSRAPLSQQPGKIPGPRLLMTTLIVSCFFTRKVTVERACQIHINFPRLSLG